MEETFSISAQAIRFFREFLERGPHRRWQVKTVLSPFVCVLLLRIFTKCSAMTYKDIMALFLFPVIHREKNSFKKTSFSVSMNKRWEKYPH